MSPMGALVVFRRRERLNWREEEEDRMPPLVVVMAREASGCESARERVYAVLVVVVVKETEVGRCREKEAPRGTWMRV